MIQRASAMLDCSRSPSRRSQDALKHYLRPHHLGSHCRRTTSRGSQDALQHFLVPRAKATVPLSRARKHRVHCRHLIIVYICFIAHYLHRPPRESAPVIIYDGSSTHSMIYDFSSTSAPLLNTTRFSTGRTYLLYSTIPLAAAILIVIRRCAGRLRRLCSLY